MKSFGLIITVITVLIAVLTFKLVSNQPKSKILIEPLFNKPISGKTSTEPTPLPPQAPKTFQFDASTNLMEELEKVNPQVLDSDFE